MISVVIPALNAEATIERAIESVLGQTHSDLEVIVVDDGSTDGTTEIAEFWARRDARVRVRTQQHAGPGAARNAGIDVATGEWLAFLDADDEFKPEAFETILHRIERHDSVGLVIFSIDAVRAYIYAWPPKLTRLKDAYFEGEGEGDRATAFMREYLRTQQMLVYSQSNKLYRRSLVEAHGLRFEQLRFGEDRLFNFAYLRHAGGVVTMSERLLSYHHGLPGTLSDVPPAEGIHALRRLSEAKLELFRDYGASEAELEAVRRRDARSMLEQTLADLMRLDRRGGAASVREAVRALLAARLDHSLFPVDALSADAAPSRRARLLQLVLRLRSAGAAAALIRTLRRRDDRTTLARRRAELDRSKAMQRLQLTTASTREQKRYYLLADYEHFLDRINPERFRVIVRDKGVLLRRLASATNRDFLGRQWLDLRRTSVDEFTQFTSTRDRIVVKRFDGASGKGVDVVDTAAPGLDAAELYERLLADKQHVVEELLHQHADLARFYESAVASLRIHTLALGDEVQIVFPTTVSFGSKGGVTSNAWSLQAFFDLETGRVETDGIFQGSVQHGTPDEVFERHPDSNVPFRGAVIPFTREAADLVRDAARFVPELPFIGWDVAITPSGPVIVEGNAAPMIHYSWQIMTRRLLGWHGMRAEFESLLERFERWKRAAQVRGA